PVRHLPRPVQGAAQGAAEGQPVMDFLNSEKVSAFLVGINTVFNSAYAGARARAQWMKIATEVPSTGPVEKYPFYGAPPRPVDWKGTRDIAKLRAQAYSLENRDRAIGVEVNLNDIDDDKFSIYGPAIQQLADGSNEDQERLVFQALADSFTGLCY